MVIGMVIGVTVDGVPYDVKSSFFGQIRFK